MAYMLMVVGVLPPMRKTVGASLPSRKIFKIMAGEDSPYWVRSSGTAVIISILIVSVMADIILVTAS